MEEYVKKDDWKFALCHLGQITQSQDHLEVMQKNIGEILEWSQGWWDEINRLSGDLKHVLTLLNSYYYEHNFDKECDCDLCEWYLSSNVGKIPECYKQGSDDV